MRVVTDEYRAEPIKCMLLRVGVCERRAQASFPVKKFV